MVKKRILCIVLTAVSVLSLCGCSSRDTMAATLPIPEWIVQRKSTSTSDDAASGVSVNFYYDNTMSMYPFVCNENGESESSNGKAAVTGTLVKVMSAMRETLQQNGGQSYTLQLNDDNEYTWAEYSGDIHNSFGNKNFYTYNGKLPSEDGAEIGPLAQIYYSGVMDSSAVNIVLTDLAEQSVNNTTLASHINNEILSQKGYAAAIIAVKCDFNGTAYIPNPDKISEVLKAEVNDKRPLYMILTGPDSKLRSIYDTLLSAMQQQGMSEDSDYYSYYKSSESTATQISDEDIIVAPAFEESDSTSFKNYFANSEFDDNLGLDQLDKSETADLFGSEDYLTIELNAFNYSKAKNSTRMILNYYVPLYDYESFGEDYQWRVATSYDDESGNSNEVNELLENKDYLVYSYLTSEEVEVTQDSSDEDVDDDDDKEEEEEDTDRRRTKSRESESSTQTVYSWVDGNKKQFDDSFTLEVKQIDFESGEDHVLSGATVIDQKGNVLNVGSDSGSGRGSSTYTLSEADEVDLSGSDHWLQITVEGKGSYDSSAVAFDIPVYAYISTTEVLPDWVSELNATANESTLGDECFTHTFNLIGFYSTLFGVNARGNTELYQVQREVKVADIVTVITNLSSNKSSGR